MAKLQSRTTGTTPLDDDLIYVTNNAGSAEVKMERNVFFQNTAEAVTATADGLTTGLITDGTRFVSVTSGNAAHVIVLPAGTIGDVILGWVGATACEMQTLAGTNTTINAVDCDGANEAALPATHFFRATKVAALTWILEGVDEDGLAAQIVPDTDA